MKKNQKPTLSSVRTPALGLLAALALAFGAPSLHAADKSEPFSYTHLTLPTIYSV